MLIPMLGFFSDNTDLQIATFVGVLLLVLIGGAGFWRK